MGGVIHHRYPVLFPQGIEAVDVHGQSRHVYGRDHLDPGAVTLEPRFHEVRGGVEGVAVHIDKDRGGPGLFHSAGCRGPGYGGHDGIVVVRPSSRHSRNWAAVQELTATASGVPWYAANSTSNWRTLGPTLIQPDLRASSTSEISSPEISGTASDKKSPCYSSFGQILPVIIPKVIPRHPFLIRSILEIKACCTPPR